MFNTTLTDEFLKCAAAFHWDQAMCEKLTLDALHVALLPDGTKAAIEKNFRQEFARLETAS